MLQKLHSALGGEVYRLLLLFNLRSASHPIVMAVAICHKYLDTPDLKER
jgi:hypothetical protein